MNKSVKLGLSSLITAGALGATLLQAPAASAAPGFVCPAGSDTIPARYGTAADGTPAIAGTVCVFAGTTAFRSLDETAGWRAVAKDVFGSSTTDVIFTRTVAPTSSSPSVVAVTIRWSHSGHLAGSDHSPQTASMGARVLSLSVASNRAAR